ncbi:MAG TPA: NnrS family protein, partial [Quisquiliibacterium sp.]|nr:NnrS family protein [Quisquiliibacterium sp.]
MSQLLRIESPASLPGPTGLPLLRLGFRPFYLLAALHAVLLVPLWVLVHRGALAAPAGLPPMWWHAHEMIYGFAFAVVTGFLFTAVRNWTGRPTPTGWRLGGLALLWVVVRVCLLLGAARAGLLLEMAFLLLVAIALLVPLLGAANRRNYFVGLLPLVLLAADAAIYAATFVDGFPVTADTMLRLALYLIVLLTGVIGGRVIPMFTLNAVRGLKQFKDVRLDRAALGAT